MHWNMHSFSRSGSSRDLLLLRFPPFRCPRCYSCIRCSGSYSLPRRLRSRMPLTLIASLHHAVYSSRCSAAADLLLGVRQGRTPVRRAPYASYARCANYGSVMTRRLLVKAASQFSSQQSGAGPLGVQSQTRLARWAGARADGSTCAVWCNALQWVGLCFVTLPQPSIPMN